MAPNLSHATPLPLMKALYHDVVGSLTSIQGFSYMAADTIGNTIEVELLNYGLSELQSTMLNLLGYCAALEGELHTANKPIEIQTCLNTMLEIIKPVAAQKDIHFTPVDLNSCSETLLLLDQERLNSILFQLFHFLILQHHQAEFSIRCELKRTQPNGLFLWLQIDTPLFEFNETLLQTPLHRNSLGPGIIVPIIQAMGGNISIEPKGTRAMIDIYIPTQITSSDSIVSL